MKKNILLILLFGLIFTIFLFSFLFIKHTFGDYLIKPIAEEGLKINKDQLTNNEINNTILWYEQWNFHFDLFFLIMWIIITATLIFTAKNSPKLPEINFTSYLIFGMLVIMFIFNYINQISQWFYSEFIGNVFTSELIHFPIYNFYMTNHPMIVFLTILVTIFTNQLFGKEKINGGQI